MIIRFKTLHLPLKSKAYSLLCRKFQNQVIATIFSFKMKAINLIVAVKMNYVLVKYKLSTLNLPLITFHIIPISHHLNPTAYNLLPSTFPKTKKSYICNSFHTVYTSINE